MSGIPTSAVQDVTLSELDAPPAITDAVVRPLRSSRYKFPPMPADAGTCGRYHFFGFPTTSHILSKLVEHCYDPTGCLNQSGCSPWDAARYLREVSGYRHLHLFSGVAQEGEEPHKYVGYIPVIPGEEATLFVGVFVNIRGLAHRRPTQRMDVLIDVLGQPRWCMDAWHMEDFDRYGVM